MGATPHCVYPVRPEEGGGGSTEGRHGYVGKTPRHHPVQPNSKFSLHSPLKHRRNIHIGLFTLFLIPSKIMRPNTRPWARPSLQSPRPTIRQHVQAIKQSQKCKCATMPARNTARSSHAGTDSDHGSEMRHATSGPNECTPNDQNARHPHERDTDASMHPDLTCGRRGVAELWAAQGRGALYKWHRTR